MSIDTPNEEYLKAAQRWQSTRDAVDGQEAVKAKKEAYLPAFIPADVARYEQYLKFAYYVNVAGRTKRGLVGAVYRKPAEIELPTELEYLLTNANGAGMGLVQSSKKAVGDVLEIGRYGLFVDYPSTEPGMTKEQVKSLDLKAYIKPFSAECGINWRTTVIGGKEALSLVVLEEDEAVAKDDFTNETKKKYTALMLVDGLYQIQIWDESGRIDTKEPTKSDGSRWDSIPFVFVGSEDNSPDIDQSPLSDLANINLAQYRNIADREAMLRMFSQMSLHIDTGEMTIDSWNEANPNGVMFGASRAIVTNGGGSVNILQANGQDLISQAIKDKSDEMISVGARVIDKNTANQTAEAARINAASENSVLDNIVGNVSAAYRKAISWVGDYNGVNTEGVVFELNQDYFDSKLNAQDVMAVIQLADRGDLTDEEVESILGKQGWKSKGEE